MTLAQNEIVEKVLSMEEGEEALNDDDEFHQAVAAFEDESVGMEAEDAELFARVQSCLGDEVLLARLKQALTDCHRKEQAFRQADLTWGDEVIKLQSVVEHLMSSRRDIEEKVSQAEKRDVEGLRREADRQKELSVNIGEECEVIEGELESLTQVLFEEVNMLVSTEARAKHEELMSTKELRQEMERVKEKLKTLQRHYAMLKTKLHSSGRLNKQVSAPDLLKEGSRSRLSLRLGGGSNKALDEIIKGITKDTTE